MKYELVKLYEASTHTVYSDLSGSGLILHAIKVGDGAGRFACVAPAMLTWAQMQLAVHLLAAVGARCVVTDLNNSEWVSDGVRWRPLNGGFTIYTQGADIVSAANASEQLLASIKFPILMLRDNDRIAVEWMAASKSNTAETATLRMRFGAGTTPLTDALVWSDASLATTNVSGGFLAELRRRSATTLRREGNPGSAGFVGVSTTAYSAAVTVPSMDAADSFLSITSQLSVGAEQLTLRDLLITVIAN